MKYEESKEPNNMKNIAIFGASRAGKTTLARSINKIYPNYHIINGDSIRKAFQKELPQNNINQYNGSGMQEDFARFSATFFKDEIKRNKGYYNYIFDSCDVSVENALKFFKDDTTIILFLGYAELTEQEALKNYRKYEKKEEWTSERTDEELIEHAKIWINNSKIFKNDCIANQVKYIDTSYNRDEILENELKIILKEISNIFEDEVVIKQIKTVSNSNDDFIQLCKELDDVHNTIVAEQRAANSSCLYELEIYKNVYIMYYNELAVGCIAFSDPIDGNIEIGRVYVREEYRNQGIATKIFEKVLRCSIEKGANSLILDTYERLEIAVKLYKKWGFQIVPQFENLKDSPYSICMKKDLIL